MKRIHGLAGSQPQFTTGNKKKKTKARQKMKAENILEKEKISFLQEN